MKRSSGVLLHISSLPGPGGIGTLGAEACAFADFLHDSGCSVWQVLPMGPTGYGESPYQSSSSYAGNPMLISLESLRDDGLLTCTDAELTVKDSEENIDFPRVQELHEALLRRCFSESEKRLSAELSAFRSSHPWVEDFALFTAVKYHFSQTMWGQWPDRAIRFREPEAMEKYRRELDEEIRYHIFCQYLFETQWQRLRAYCHKLGISIFGDMPIYVSEDSADTWTNPEVFQFDENLIPTKVAGVPPDYFSENGQLWGNPLYRWDYLESRHFDWWVMRMKRMAELYDIVRVDHFIGFANYYSIPYGSTNAKVGEWINAPGFSLFETLRQHIGGLQIIAEDLGVVSDRVKKLISATGYPGMRVLVFGFSGDDSNVHALSNWVENCVAYTGTHDNDTVLGYLKRVDPEEVSRARKELGFTALEDGPDAFVSAVFHSPANLVIVPMQDLLGLDNSARMNTPSTVGGNWRWRIGKMPTQAMTMKLKSINRKTDRLA